MNELNIRFLETYDFLKNTKNFKNASEFAEMVGVSSSMITEILKGRASPGTKVLQNIVKFNIDVNWLLTGLGNMLIQPKSLTVLEDKPQTSNHAAEDAVPYGSKPDLRKLYAQEMDLHQQLFALQQQLHDVRMRILGAEAESVR